MYFVNAKKGLQDWWRYLVTLSAAIFSYLVIGALPLGGVIAYKTMRGHSMDVATFTQTYNAEALGISQNFGLILLLFPAVLGFFTLWVCIKQIHQFSNGQIASAFGKIRWSRLFWAAGIWLAFLVIAELGMLLKQPENYAYHFNAQKFFPLLLIAILLIPFQTWFEELLFRGYLMQGIGLLFRSRLLALILTAAAFGLLHATNPEVKSFGLAATMPYYIGFGLFAGLLVILDNGIEMACGIHAVSNIYSAVFVSYESSVLQTPAIWSIQKLNPWAMNLVFLLAAVVFILIAAKKYQWGSWKKLVQPINFQQDL